MKIGYARVSTTDQSLDAQHDRLKQEGCEDIYSDKISGVKAARPGLDELLKYARKYDVIVITKLDRLGRSMKE